MIVFHSLERTSPKGPGQRFIGTCRLCGAPDLPASAMMEECPNQRGLTSDQALIEAIDPPGSQLKERTSHDK